MIINNHHLIVIKIIQIIYVQCAVFQPMIINVNYYHRQILMKKNTSCAGNDVSNNSENKNCKQYAMPNINEKQYTELYQVPKHISPELFQNKNIYPTNKNNK